MPTFPACGRSPSISRWAYLILYAIAFSLSVFGWCREVLALWIVPHILGSALIIYFFAYLPIRLMLSRHQCVLGEGHDHRADRQLALHVPELPSHPSPLPADPVLSLPERLPLTSSGVRRWPPHPARRWSDDLPQGECGRGLSAAILRERSSTQAARRKG